MEGMDVLALIGVLVTFLVGWAKKELPALLTPEKGERTVALSIGLSVALTWGAYALGLLPAFTRAADALLAGLVAALVANGLYAATKPFRKDSGNG